MSRILFYVAIGITSCGIRDWNHKVWILQSLNTTWFNNLPLFDEDKSLMLVLYLIEPEAVLAKHSFKQNIELLIFG